MRVMRPELLLTAGAAAGAAKGGLSPPQPFHAAPPPPQPPWAQEVFCGAAGPAEPVQKIIISRVIHYICIPAAPAGFSCAEEVCAVQLLQAADLRSNRAAISQSFPAPGAPAQRPAPASSP